jgi:hypothetical protein
LEQGAATAFLKPDAIPAPETIALFKTCILHLIHVCDAEMSLTGVRGLPGKTTRIDAFEHWDCASTQDEILAPAE